MNLQSNALKFTSEGKITIKADKIRYNNDDFIQIAVIDTGVGIKPED